MTQADVTQDCCHIGKVKVRSGGSIVKVKPLFTYDSKYLLIASGCIIKVYSVSSGECVLIFKGHDHPVVSIRANKKNKLQILSCSEEGTVIRWDFLDGKALKKYNLKAKSKVAAFFAPTADGPWYYTAKVEDTDYYRLYSLVFKGTKASEITVVMRPVNPEGNAVDFGPAGIFIAGVGNNTLHLHQCQTKKYRAHMVGNERNFTCVACHPSDYIVATGDSDGRIIVWAGAFDSSFPARSLYHWHSSSLPDFIFSAEGSHIYSAGNESVLVKWNLNEDTKHTIPRLGLPMCAITASPDNTYIAFCHIDNAVQIINSRNVVVQIIQGLTQGHCQSNKSSSERVPTGMLYDPLTGALVMNGRPGHLQFYNVKTDKQHFQLNIVGRNYISQDKDSIIYNTDVEKAAIHSTGLWLATVEYRDDGETSLEMCLKFWQYDTSAQKFVLNTNIFLPHNKRVNCLKFRPDINEDNTDANPAPMAVTTGDDDRFKIWTLNSGQESSWSCDLVGYYKDLNAGDACFSEDGSLLAVVFDFMVTLWSPESNVLKTTFSNRDNSSPVRKVLFGRGSSSHLLVCHNDVMLTVWNVLTLSALWNVKCYVEYIVDDPLSDIMASFTNDGNLLVFRPTHPKPIAVVKNVASSTVISAIFIPRPKLERNRVGSSQCCWQSRSQLYFMNKDQLLITISGEEDDDNDEVNKNSTELLDEITLKKIPVMTPFGMLQAEHKVTDVKPTKHEKHIFNKDEKEDELPCPTHVNPISLCNSVLSAALEPYLRKSNIREEDVVLPASETNTVLEYSESTDSKLKNDESEKSESMEISESIPDHDYSFLLNCFS